MERTKAGERSCPYRARARTFGGAFGAFGGSWARRARGLAIRHSPSCVVRAPRWRC